MKAALTSYARLDTNPDGSADVYFDPVPPEGRQAHWLQTVPGKGWFVYFRWYGLTRGLLRLGLATPRHHHRLTELDTGARRAVPDPADASMKKAD
jgi:hypothetical protein